MVSDVAPQSLTIHCWRCGHEYDARHAGPIQTQCPRCGFYAFKREIPRDAPKEVMTSKPSLRCNV